MILSSLLFDFFSNRVGSSHTHSKASLSSEAKMPPPESDTDSMAEYGEGEAGNLSLFSHFFTSLLLAFTLVWKHKNETKQIMSVHLNPSDLTVVS